MPNACRGTGAVTRAWETWRPQLSLPFGEPKATEWKACGKCGGPVLVGTFCGVCEAAS